MSEKTQKPLYLKCQDLFDTFWLIQTSSKTDQGNFRNFLGGVSDVKCQHSIENLLAKGVLEIRVWKGANHPSFVCKNLLVKPWWWQLLLKPAHYTSSTETFTSTTSVMHLLHTKIRHEAISSILIVFQWANSNRIHNTSQSISLTK